MKGTLLTTYAGQISEVFPIKNLLRGGVKLDILISNVKVHSNYSIFLFYHFQEFLLTFKWHHMTLLNRNQSRIEI